MTDQNEPPPPPKPMQTVTLYDVYGSKVVLDKFDLIKAIANVEDLTFAGLTAKEIIFLRANWLKAGGTLEQLREFANK